MTFDPSNVAHIGQALVVIGYAFCFFNGLSFGLRFA